MAAWDYAMVYFLAVWKAAVLGVLLGSLIQVLIPRDWLLRTLGQSRFQGTLLGSDFLAARHDVHLLRRAGHGRDAQTAGVDGGRWRSGWGTRCSIRRRWCLWVLFWAGSLRWFAWWRVWRQY